MTATPKYLEWPEGWPRTSWGRRVATNKFDGKRGLTIASARDDLRAEFGRLGAQHVRLSIDLPSVEYTGGPKPGDPGVAVYFHYRGKPHVMACDTYCRCEHNLRALALTVEAIRAIERHGASGILDRAMSGFTALPPGSGAEEKPRRPWWEVLGVPALAGLTFQEITSDPAHPMRLPVLKMAEALYRGQVPTAHPDKGGSHEAMSELARAIEEARAALSKEASA